MYDLLLKNAWVVDPLNSVNGVADVAIQDTRTTALTPFSRVPSPSMCRSTRPRSTLTARSRLL